MTDKQVSESGVKPRLRGVFVAKETEELLPQHRKIIRRIADEIIAFGLAEVAEEKEVRGRPNPGPSEAYYQSVLHRQPHQAFLIDGPKGAGKTTLLLNLRCALQQIGPKGGDRREPNVFDVDDLLPKSEKRVGSLSSFTGLQVGPAPRFLVHALPLIRPDSMEAHESIMECVLAEMTHMLAQEEGKTTGARTRTEQTQLERARELTNQLHTEVAKGWYFAKRLGLEALLNDSMNFDEYIVRRSQEAVISHRRIARWMRFVNDYLEYFDSQMLAIFIDDTDISADLAADILHTTRMFFCHPRIVVLMAGNLHTMRQRLLTRAMIEQAEAHKSLRSPESFTARFWRDFERENLEEYLSKVLPRPYRHFISPSAPDAEQLLLRNSFVEFCGIQMRARLPAFLKERKTTRQRGVQDTRVRWSRYEALLALAEQPNRYHTEAENHIALWLLRNHYAAYLSPQTARHINQFRAMIDHKPTAPSDSKTPSLLSKDDMKSSRRVVVALFTHPGNHSVLQRQSDFDADAATWINRQNVQMNWRGTRWLKLNALTLPHGTPPYELLLFRLDLILARPTAAWLQPGFAMSLLPEPSGRKIWAPEVWQEQDRSAPSIYLGYEEDDGTVEVASWQIVELQNHRLRFRQELPGLPGAFSSPIIPANCLYFKDLRAFPDLAWVWDDINDKADYRRFFDQFPVRNIDNMFRLDRYDPRAEYFRDVVLVFGSYPLVQPIPSEEFVTDSRALHQWELSDFSGFEEGSLPKPLPPAKGDAFKTIKAVSHGLAERYRYALSGEDKPIKYATSKMVRRMSPPSLAENIEDVVLSQPASASPRPNPTALRAAQRVVSLITPRYHRILNDVRRAYHAMRILEADINNYAFIARVGPAGNKQSGDDTVGRSAAWPQPFEHNRNDVYSLMEVDKFRVLIGLPAVPRGTAPPERPVTADTRYWIPISRRRPPDNEEENGNQAQQAPPDDRGLLLPPFWTVVRERLHRTPEGREQETTTERIITEIGVGFFERTLWQTAGSAQDIPAREREGLRQLFDQGPSTKMPYVLSCRREDQKTNPFSPAKWTLMSKKGELGLEVDNKPGTRKTNNKRVGSGYLLRVLKHLCRKSGHTMRDEHPLLFDTRTGNHAQEARMYRSILLMLWGLTPCLSSLIHLEIMGKFYSAQDPAKATAMGGKANYLEEMAEDLDVWEATVACAMISTIMLALTLEMNLDADFVYAEKESAFEKAKGAPQFCAIPDISIATLGLRLYVGDDDPPEGQVKDDKNYYRGVIADKFVKRKFTGIVGDVLMRLQLTLYYIDQLRDAFGKVWEARKT